MKNSILIILVFCFSFSINGQTKRHETVKQKEVPFSKGFIRCATSENEEIIRKNNSKRLNNQEFEEWLSPFLIAYKNNSTNRSETGGIITIPVVVHVIHNGDLYGNNENIKDEQVQSQITVLNQDFRKLVGTPGFGLGVDTQIQFALAKVDPNGNPTNGINRVNLCRSDWNAGSPNASINLVNTDIKPQTIWNANQYLNMWSVNFGSSGLLGYAQFPDASGLPGLDASGGLATTDGVVSNYGTFGSRVIFPTGNYIGNQYDKGRTMTHEVGHWLGLRHIWGEDGAGGCESDDYCNDTPNAANSNGGCPLGTDTCPASPGNDMIENYMDYTDDSCMNIFTADQKTRMVVIMNNASRRRSLRTSTKDLAIPLFANDAEILIENYCNNSIENQCLASSNIHKLHLYNRGTSNITSAVITYDVSGGASQEYLYSGNLAPNKYTTFEITTTEVSGILNATITSVNNTTDQRSGNNSKSKPFSFGASSNIPSYNLSKVVFRLQTDQYGSETTWNLKDASGTVLYSGGPYEDAIAGETSPLITQNWTLAQGNCYSFTINDAYDDGICCAYGNGFYDIKSTNGSIVIASGNSFDASANHAFKTGVFEETESDETIFIYPNPINTSLELKIAESFGTPLSYEVYNSIGQMVLFSETINTPLNIDTSALLNGTYLIKISFKSGAKTLRFIKN